MMTAELSQAAVSSKLTSVHYVVWSIGPGGAELGIRNFIDRFGHKRDIHVYGIRRTADKIFMFQENVRIAQGTQSRWKPYLEYFRYCRQHKNDVFHLKNGGPVVLLISLLAGVRFLIYHIHGTIYWTSPAQKMLLKPVWLLAAWFSKGTKTKFVANSMYSASVFKDQVLPVDPEVIYNGFTIDRFMEQKRLRTEVRKIGYAGRLYAGKNVDMTIRLFNEIAADRPELELHIAGAGPLRKSLEALAQNTPCADRIVFHGMVEDMPAFYGSLDVLIFLSAYESFGNVVAEALLTGLPVLASDLPAFKEIFGEHRGFVMGQPSDYETIKRNVEQAFGIFPVLAQTAYDLSDAVVAQCDLDLHLSKIENLYETH
jgi:glycosyltransferase involved in cell wall biosynthesis